LFLLKYIDNEDVRKNIQTSTNKSEQFNSFTKWLFFGNDGIIAENVKNKQKEIIKYNQLVANMVILYNVSEMTKVLVKLKKSGNIEITSELLGHLNPYRKSHLNRFGSYLLDTKRKINPLEYKQKIL